VAIQYGYPMGTWDVSRLTDFSLVFMVNRKQELTWTVQLARMREMVIPDLSGWDVSRATTMKGMFAGATAFTGEGLAGWDVGLVVDFLFSFFEASEFLGDLSNWNTTSARTMAATFSEATSFNGDLSNWDMSAVEAANSMFSGAFKYQGGDLTRWNVSSVRDMANMFGTTYAFTGNVSSWNTGNVERLDSMVRLTVRFWHILGPKRELTNFDVDAMSREGTHTPGSAKNRAHCKAHGWKQGPQSIWAKRNKVLVLDWRSKLRRVSLFGSDAVASIAIDEKRECECLFLFEFLQLLHRRFDRERVRTILQSPQRMGLYQLAFVCWLSADGSKEME
jgi:Mycoplasma protein of unknown function, DUF285